MKKTLLFVIAITALMAAPLLAAPYGGYDVVVDPVGQDGIGSFAITSHPDSEVQVDLTGTITIDRSTQPPTITVEVVGTITTPDGTYEVNKTFVFDGSNPNNRRTWKRIIGWIDNIVNA